MDYDKIAEHYDNWYEWYFFTKEDEKVAEMINYTSGLVFDIGCWTGLWKEILKTDTYVWLDISKELIKIAVKKNPNAHFINSSILDVTVWVKAQLSIALYGVMNYLTNEEIEKIIESSEEFFLMDYIDWYHPVCYPNNEFPERKFDTEKFAKYFVWKFNNYNIYTNVNK